MFLGNTFTSCVGEPLAVRLLSGRTDVGDSEVIVGIRLAFRHKFCQLFDSKVKKDKLKMNAEQPESSYL